MAQTMRTAVGQDLQRSLYSKVAEGHNKSRDTLLNSNNHVTEMDERHPSPSVEKHLALTSSSESVEGRTQTL